MRSQIIKDTWQAMKDRILDGTGIILPYDPALNLENNDDVRVSLTRLWEIRSDNPRQAQVVLAVLVSFCDAIVWWKNRLAQESFSDDEVT
jgi:hypothetical protein